MLSDPSNAHKSSTDPVPRGAACRSMTSDPGLASGAQEGEDMSGRLAGTPPIARGSPSSTEGGPSRYTHLLHVDLQDAGRR